MQKGTPKKFPLHDVLASAKEVPLKDIEKKNRTFSVKNLTKRFECGMM